MCSENKDADLLRGTMKLICVFVFAYAKSRFSHNEAHLSAFLLTLRPSLCKIITLSVNI